MINEIQTFGLIAELTSVVLFAVVVYYVLKIGKITGSFTAWNMIASAFILIMLRRVLSFAQNYLPYGWFIDGIIEPIILFTITVLFIIGFRQLTDAFAQTPTK